MKKILCAILILVVTSFLGVEAGEYFASPIKSFIEHLIPFSLNQAAPVKTPMKPLNEIRKALHDLAPTLSANVINAVITTLTCADKNNIDHNQILTVIDYSLPSNEKRLWVFDLAQNKLLFNTYVSHGIQSGALLSTNFSNKYNGKASSMGIFNTDKAYRGRHGSSLKLYGLDKNFNDNAYNRAIVIHGAWYVEEWFIKKYGRAGRSWGCPALPYSLTKPVIDTIKENALLIVYYPNPSWLSQSKFLNCDISKATASHSGATPVSAAKTEAEREAIMYIDLNHDGKREENEPVVIISADNYKNIFKKEVPLERMLRRQINHSEYVALTSNELKQLDDSQKTLLAFVTPTVKMQRGWYVTEMNMMPLGKIKQITANTSGNFTIFFDNKPPFEIKSDDRFIRWVGL